ncbi:MAG: MlaD family protein [Leptospirales bacterium]
MKRSSNLRFSEIRVGLIVGVSFFLGALAIISYGKVQNLFSKQVPLTILFNNVRGLTVGAPVRISGMTSGFVRQIHFIRYREHQFVQVQISLSAKRLSDLSEETTAIIRTQGLMGIKYLDLIPGDLSKGPLNKEIPITGTDTKTMESVLGKGNDLVKTLNHVSLSLDALLNDVREGHGTIGRIMTESDLYDNLSATTRDLRTMVQGINTGNGPLSSMIHSKEMSQKLDHILNHLDQVLAELSDPHGSVSVLTRDPVAAGELKNSIHQLSAILAAIGSGKGAIGEMLYDPQMGRKMNDTVDKMNSLLDDMKKDPRKYFTVNVHVF